ncbi:MAG TPA: tetratricopeptide repeat protein [Verrucomicrobiae bacterium]|nr:tetratricopeptide repeat protein [Verrucomicrobiae bacterium]
MKAPKFYPLVVVAAGLLAYSNSFTGSYFHDDFGAIMENPTVHHLWPIWQPLLPLRGSDWPVAGRPLINLSLAINYAIGGYHVWGYHALNLLVHILAGLTLFGIVRRTLLAPTLVSGFGAAADELALATAVLWMVHPMQTESVTYIVQRAESVMGLFYLLTLYCFIRGVESERKRLWYGLSMTACALGMASKQVMVSAPLMVVLYDRAFLSGSFRQAGRQRWPVYLGLAAGWIVLIATMVSADFYNTVSKINEGHHLNRWTYLLTQSEVIVNYLGWSVWPYHLPLLVNTFRPGNVILPGAAILLLLGASAWALGKNSAWGFLGAWFFIILAPTSSLLPSIDPIFLHRMYLPLAAVVSSVVMGLYAVWERQSLIVFAAIAIGLGVLTRQENQIFSRDPHYSLGLAYGRIGRMQEAVGEYEQALRTMPDDAWLQCNLASALVAVGQPEDAIKHFEQALRLQPEFAEAHCLLGSVLSTMGDTDAAIWHYQQALRIRPDYAEAHYDWGVTLARAGRITEAIGHYDQTLRLKPDHAEAHNAWGLALTRLGQIPEAVGHWEQALRLRPDYAEAHYNLGVALAQLNRVPEAIGHWETAVRIKPDYADAHNNLGGVYLRLGRLREAIAQFDQALRTAPDLVEAHYNLGIALEQMGRVQEAVQQYDQALRLKPDYAEARDRLAKLRAAQ